jgi:tripartite-type tricarboxylate transporter receptor subunit TctC
VFAKVSYEPVKDFTPIVMVAQSPLMLVVNAAVPAQTLQDLIKLAKAQPGKFTIASAGTGASSHVVAELFKMRAGINMTHVPYKGLGPALTEVAGGQVNSLFSSIPAAMQLVKSGKLRVLGVCSSKRVAVAPEVPTMEEGGGNRGTTAAMANLAEAIQGLVAHMRNEQQMIREWADGQGEQNREIKKLLERIARQPEKN